MVIFVFSYLLLQNSFLDAENRQMRQGRVVRQGENSRQSQWTPQEQNKQVHWLNMKRERERERHDEEGWWRREIMQVESRERILAWACGSACRNMREEGVQEHMVTDQWHLEYGNSCQEFDRRTRMCEEEMRHRVRKGRTLRYTTLHASSTEKTRKHTRRYISPLCVPEASCILYMCVCVYALLRHPKSIARSHGNQ